mgnify:FL=1
MPGVQVYKRATWRYRFEAAPVGGKRRRVEKSGFRTKKEALVAGTKAYNEYLNVGRTFVPSEISVADYLDEWLELRKPELRPNSIRIYSQRIKMQIKPALGKYKLSAITAADIQRLINDLFMQGVSRETIAGVKSVLTNALKYAVEPMGYLQHAPIDGVKLPSRRVRPPVPPRTRVREPITPADWMQIKELISGKSGYLAFVIGYHTGMRAGEVLGLSWEDIDFDNKTLHVRHQQQRLEKGIFITEPKYESSRIISMDGALIAELLNEKRRQQHLTALLDEQYPRYTYDASGKLSIGGGGTPFDPVCRRQGGLVLRYASILYCVSLVHKNLELPNFDFHTLRHTHATMLVSAGISPLLVQERLGHKNIQVTLGLYASLTDVARAKETAAINELFGE